MSHDNQKMFLQGCLARGVLEVCDMKELLQACDVNADSEEEIISFILRANQAIAPFNLEIKKGAHEENGALLYCLVNTVETAISRLSSTYTPNELELFKKLIEQIVDTDDGKVGSLLALSLTEKLDKRMGKEEAQNFFDRLEKDKWIKKDEEGKLSLHARSIIELEQYLKELYTDCIKSCNICSKICLLGELCKNCGIKLHRKCAEKLFASQGSTKKCPDCKVPWGHLVIL